MWSSKDLKFDSEEEINVTFPKELLKCEELARYIEFKSGEEIKDFSLLQKMSVNGEEIE
jgi:hypothetical protein